MQTFLALSLAYILSIFFRTFLSVLATRMMADMQIGATGLAVMSSSWFVVFALMQFPVGWALDRFGPRRTVLPLMLVGGIGVVLLPLAGNVWTGAFAMGLIGMGCSPIYMGALYVFARNHPAAQFGLLASLLIGFGSIGNLAGTMPLAWLAEAYGWRQTLALLAVLYGVAFVLAALLLRDPPKLERQGSDGIFAGIGAVAAMPIVRLAAPIIFVSYATISAIRGLWVGPFLERVTGLTPAAQGQAVLAMAVAMTASAFAAGWVQSRFGGAKTMAIVGNSGVAATLGMLAALGTPAAHTAIGLYVLMGLAGFTFTILMAHVRPFFPDHLVGRGITMLNFLFIGGTAAVQTFSGWLIDLGLRQGLDPAATYARMHGVLAVILLASVLVYVAAPARPAEEPA